MWFKVHPREPDYVSRAPCRIEVEATIAAPAAALFAMVSSGRAMRNWMADFVSIRWMSAPPHGVGSTRELMLKTMALRERVLIWNPGARLTMSVYGITAPLVREMVEDIRLSPLGDLSTRMHWGLYYAPSFSLRLVHPLARAVFDTLLHDSIRALAQYAPVQQSAVAP